MHFVYPSFLWLLFVPLGFALYQYKTRSHSYEKHFSKVMLAKLTLGAHALSSSMKYRLFLMMIVLMLLALARPVVPMAFTNTTQTKASVILAIDVSKSMYLSDLYPNRYTLALQKLKDFVTHASTFNIGILFYAKEAYMLYPLSKESGLLRRLVNDINITQKFAPQTNLFAALEASKQLLGSYKNRHILLLSDGGEENNYTQEKHYLQQAHIILDVLLLNKQPSPWMQRLSEQTGGHYQPFSFSDQDIQKLSQSITSHAKQSQNYHYATPHFKEYYAYPLGLAMGLLALLFLPLRQKEELLVILLLLVFASPPSVQAGLLDFWTIHQAKEASKHADYTKVIARYKSLPKSAETYYALGTAAYRNASYIQAVTYYQKALRPNDKSFNAKVYFNIATTYVRKHNLDLAKKYYKKSLALFPYIQTKENLTIVTKQLHSERKNLHKKFQKLVFKPIAKQNNYDTKKRFEHYAIKLNKLLPKQEDQWFLKLQKYHGSSYLQIIPTSKRSQDANKPW